MFLATVVRFRSEPKQALCAGAPAEGQCSPPKQIQPSRHCGAGGPSCGGPRTTGALVSRTPPQKVGPRCAVIARPCAAWSKAQSSIKAFPLPSPVLLGHTAGMQITALFSPSFSQAALQSKASCSGGKGPASNPSIKRTVKGLRPLPAAYVKR